MTKNNPITVSQLNHYLKGIVDEDPNLRHIFIKGEISNLKYHNSGHIYFTLKDNKNQISGIMFKGNTGEGLTFRLKDGDKVVITGYISIYEKNGKCQIYAQKIELEGTGDLFKRYEELKQELLKSGMFDEKYKKPLPYYAKKIGIVTAPTGAAIRDIIHISKSRNPYISLVLYPALVQGKDASASIVKGIEMLNKIDCDAIIVGRGGGSIEDLWAFNEKIVADAIFKSKIPIVSAVGHETDTTISDFVADKRASTPSHAAEILVRPIKEIEDRISLYKKNLFEKIFKAVFENKKATELYYARLKALSPESKIKLYKSKIISIRDNLFKTFDKCLYLSKYRLEKDLCIYDKMREKLEESKVKLRMYANKIDASSPLKKLSSGYAYPENEKGNHISYAKDIKIGDNIIFTFEDGNVRTKALDVKLIDYKNEK